ncbi:MAG: cytochrome b N-terminal domain-containing protein [Dehalococcoidales bacterium]|jgi:quinol-cytochrome oxidoreductase complex cytochrome b subunit|nr:cytochrome b N-terminal domain-containing protein [Dehalococcoidales bacterium]|tara:strand:- start:1396 stop:2160 length:765 start_codon:yes stop_codon:yes gene_type:complete
MMPDINAILKIITRSQIWRSVFRQGYPNTDENRSKTIVNSWFLHIHPVKVRKHTLKVSYTWGMGFITFFLFMVLVVTGIYLMFFYAPSIERAYTDIQALETSITFGMLMRNMHRWAAHLMVISVFLHLCRVFFTGGYKRPREFNWVIGVILWVLTLVLSYTGYLLPWDQLAYWAVTVGTNIAGVTPLIGDQVRLILLGAMEAGPDALVRFYALHIALLPGVMTVLIGIHFWRIRKDGGLSNPDEITEDQTEGAA